MTDAATPRTAPTGADLDHTSFAVRDAMGVARRLRREAGATPVIGEVLAEFRYLMLYIGTPERGAMLELMDPTGPGFLRRFLDKRGDGPHHLTFTVPDLRGAVAHARELGLTIVGEDYDHPRWREAFIAPEPTHAVVVQMAETDRRYPSPAELLATRARDLATIPLTAAGADPLWWTALWETVPHRAGVLGTTHLGSGDLAFSRRLFEGVLGGAARAIGDGIEFSWPGGRVRAVPGGRPGVRAMSLRGDGVPELRIGPTRLGDLATTGTPADHD